MTAKRKSSRTARTVALTDRSTLPESLAPPGLLQRGETDRPLPGTQEVNERCIEMLVHAARHERHPFALVAELRELLVLTTPVTRRRIAQRAFLLVDMHFRNSDWWHCVHSRPADSLRNRSWRGSFPRPSAVQLVRATLILAWNGLRTNPATTCVLLGMAPGVARIISALKLDEIDRIAQKHSQHVHARWDDRPAVWRRLLLAAGVDEEKPMGEFNLHALQLLAGELWAPRPGDTVNGGAGR